jgi:hypothetical protein
MWFQTKPTIWNNRWLKNTCGKFWTPYLVQNFELHTKIWEPRQNNYRGNCTALLLQILVPHYLTPLVLTRLQGLLPKNLKECWVLSIISFSCSKFPLGLCNIICAMKNCNHKNNRGHKKLTSRMGHQKSLHSLAFQTMKTIVTGPKDNLSSTFYSTKGAN